MPVADGILPQPEEGSIFALLIDVSHHRDVLVFSKIKQHLNPFKPNTSTVNIKPDLPEEPRLYIRHLPEVVPGHGVVETAPVHPPVLLDVPPALSSLGHPRDGHVGTEVGPVSGHEDKAEGPP